MFVKFKKLVLASLILLTVLATGAWQSNSIVSAERQTTNPVETPLYPGLTWSSPGSTTENIRINIKGDSISVTGERFEAQEQFVSDIPLPQDLVNYYSNAELAKSGWASYDAFDGSDGAYYVFYHESGVYLSVEFLRCQSDPTRTCVAVWKSEPVNSQVTLPAITSAPETLNSANASSFSKTSPANGATGVNASSVTLKWETYSSAEKYTYCVQESDCEVGSTDWTSTYNTSVTLPALLTNKTYHWQVRALTCGDCSPKEWVYANNGTSWTFSTQTSRVAIVGNAGVAGATLSYVDGTTKKVTSDNTGAYSITVPYKWSGTITPSKSGYLFYPTSATFSNLTASQTIQNFTAVLSYVISGNTGLAGVTLSYVDGTPRTILSDGSGNYSFIVPSGWSSTVTPSLPCFSFTPPSRTYSNVTASLSAQNYAAAFNPASGCARVTVNISTTLMGVYTLPSGGRVMPAFNVVNGPVNVRDTKGTSILTSERINNASGFVNELIGIPNNQITTEYWFPWYDNVSMASWILVGNPSTTTDAHVHIYIAGVEQAGSPYTIPHGGKITPRYTGVMTGPVHIVSDINVFTTERVHTGQGFVNELVGVPNNRLTTEYWFPWYDNVSMASWIVLANPDPVNDAQVHVFVGGAEQPGSPYTVPHGSRITERYTGLAGGPVHIVSDINVITSERVHNATGFINEIAGTPNNKLASEYWFPWYDNVNTASWILVGNPSTTNDAHVHIYIGGVEQSGSPYTVPHGGKITPRYAGVVNGPVHIVSDINVFTSERIHTPGQGFVNEAMGIPNNELTTEYWFPWYDNVNMKSWILLDKP